jgi:hypothetical protein
MQEPSVDNALALQNTRNLSSDPVMSEIHALLQHVRASIHVVEAAMNTDGDAPGDSDDFFILDDITPRYLKLRRLLDVVDAGLCAALHDS